MVFLDVRDDGKTLWVVNEYYWDSREENAQKTDKQYADDLIAFIGPEGAERVVIDPSAASFIAELRTRDDRNFIISEADNEVLDGIRMTATMIAAGLIRVHKDNCPNTLKEITSYVWDEKAAQRGEEKPVKVADHTADALRYGVKTIIKPFDLANRLAA
jgi:phage terminase large subunit